MADISSIKPYGSSGASYNYKDATARTNITTLYAQDEALESNIQTVSGRVTTLTNTVGTIDSRVTALENAGGGGDKIYQLGGFPFSDEDMEVWGAGDIIFDSSNRTWSYSYDDTLIWYAPTSNLIPEYPSTTVPTPNVGDIVAWVSYDDGYGWVRRILAIMNSTTIPTVIQNIINNNPYMTTSDRTAYFNALRAQYNAKGPIMCFGQSVGRLFSFLT